jgi:uncharacterized membrane protein (UPF0127 family)
MTLARRLLALLMLTAIGCDARPASTSSLRTTTMQIGGKTFTMEVADSDSTREFGLMKRDSLPADRGMIFVFPVEEPRSFYMMNTRIPLDIAYLRSDGTIVSMHRMRPYDLTPTRSERPARYAVELNAGILATTGVNVGDKLQIPADAREPAR